VVVASNLRRDEKSKKARWRAWRSIGRLQVVTSWRRSHFYDGLLRLHSVLYVSLFLSLVFFGRWVGTSIV